MTYAAQYLQGVDATLEDLPRGVPRLKYLNASIDAVELLANISGNNSGPYALSQDDFLEMRRGLNDRLSDAVR